MPQHGMVRLTRHPHPTTQRGLAPMLRRELAQLRLSSCNTASGGGVHFVGQGCAPGAAAAASTFSSLSTSAMQHPPPWTNAPCLTSWVHRRVRHCAKTALPPPSTRAATAVAAAAAAGAQAAQHLGGRGALAGVGQQALVYEVRHVLQGIKGTADGTAADAGYPSRRPNLHSWLPSLFTPQLAAIPTHLGAVVRHPRQLPCAALQNQAPGGQLSQQQAKAAGGGAGQAQL